MNLWLLSLFLATAAPEQTLLRLEWGHKERAASEHEIASSHPNLAEVRGLLRRREAGERVDSVGPIALGGYEFSVELEISRSIRVVAISCFLGGGLLAFDSKGALTGSYRTWEIKRIELLDLDCDDTFQLHTVEEDVRGTGIHVELHHIYRFRTNEFQHLWSGLDNGHVSGWTKDDQEVEGFVRFSSLCSGSPEIAQVLRDLKNGKVYFRRWRLKGDRFEPVQSAG